MNVPSREHSSPSLVRRSTRLSLRVLFLLILVYSGFCLMLAFLQRQLIYAPRKADVTLEQSGFATNQIREVYLPLDSNIQLIGWYCQSVRESTDQLNRLAIIFAGNAGNRLNRVPLVTLMTELGCDVLIFDYRGYGGSGGNPSEAALAEDSHKVWDFARNELGFANDKILILGQSLGGGVATRLTAELCQQNEAPAGLVLYATFSSLVDAAKVHYPWLPVSLLLVDRYPSIERIPEITCPLLSIHGRPDQIVPFDLGERLFQAAPKVSASGVQKRFLELPTAGHNDILHVALDEVRQAKQQFLSDIEDAAAEK